jgi:hypothetical protein
MSGCNGYADYANGTDNAFYIYCPEHNGQTG